MMLTTRLFVFLLHHLWRVMRWTGLTVYHGISVLYRRRQARLQASDWRPERCIPVAGSWPMMVSSAVGPLFSGSGMR